MNSQPNSNIKPSTNTGGSQFKYGPSKPFIILQPGNLFVSLSNFSPIITGIFVLTLSLASDQPSFKGLVYLAFLIASSFFRNYAYQAADLAPITESRCNFIRYSKFGNTTFSIFVLSFTLAYLSVPMFQTNSINYIVFAILVFYFVLDIGNKVVQGCLNFDVDGPYVLLDMVLGLFLASVIVMFMQLGGSDKFLFYTEMIDNKLVCKKPTSTTMKCAVYRNGELIS
jgi:hypothetical protein